MPRKRYGLRADALCFAEGVAGDAGGAASRGGAAAGARRVFGTAFAGPPSDT
jgi:hypothetical protein